MNAWESGALADAVTPAEAVDKGEIFLFRFSDRLSDRAIADSIDAEGLFSKDMLVLFDGILEMLPAESRGGCEEDDIDAAVDHLFVCVQAGEFHVISDLDLLGMAFAV